MIEIVSLFLGLVVGENPVKLDASRAVATVELRLDGAIVERLEEPPWETVVDLGAELAPHELVAVAFDQRGREVDRDRVWVNLAQKRVDASLSWIPGDDGLPEGVSLHWESIGQRSPESIELRFDGAPLPFEDPARVPLPDYDPESLHYLSADLYFSETVTTRLEASFGGGRLARVEAELTAVAVELDGRRRLPPPRKLQGWFLADGEPARVHGVEQGPPQLYTVRDLSTRPLFDQLAESMVKARISGLQDPVGKQQLVDFDASTFFPMHEGSNPWSTHRDNAPLRSALVALSRLAPLEKGTQIRFVSPVSAPLYGNSVHPAMFIHGEPRDGAEGGLLWMSRQPRPLEFPQQINDAVALAGMLAQSSHQPRAVLLVQSDSSSDHSGHSPETVAQYLKSLQVPLYIWTLGAEEPNTPWAGAPRTHVTYLGDPAKRRIVFGRLQEAVEALNRSLSKQRIVWLEGRRLPSSIELGPEAKGIRLAGSR